MSPDPIPFVVYLDGTAYEYWTEMDVTRSIERMSGEFRLKLTRKDTKKDIYLDGSINTGAAVRIEIAGQTVLDGWVDDVKFNYDARDSAIEVTGRDKTGDLIDCAAATNGKYEFTNMKLDAIVRKIIEPYGLTLTVATEVGEVFPRFAIQPGESAFDCIDRACKFRQVLAVSDGIGGIVLVKPSEEKSPGRLVYGENILKGDVLFDAKELFSLYIIKGQAEPVDAETEAAVTASPEARSVSTVVKRYRPKVIVGENQGYDMTLKERAAWEKKMAEARSRRATFTVQGWYADATGAKLWKPNTLVNVKDKPSGLARDMLITGVSFSRSNAGTITTLDLAMPESFDLPAQKDDSSNNSTLWAADP